MANASTFVAGLGGGLGLWYLMRHTTAANTTATSTNATSTTPAATTASAGATPSTTNPLPRNASIGLDARGVCIGGTYVDVAEAARRCIGMDRVELSVAPTAPASTYAELVAALESLNIGTSPVRNASGRRAKTSGRGSRNRDTATTFTLATYPEGIGGPKRVRWFRADAATTWESARDRLAQAGLLDLRAVEPHLAGAWILTSAPEAFRPDRAEPLPGNDVKPRGARRATPRHTHEGRTILRDGTAIVHVDRVDLGDERYGVSPYEADQLVARIVHLLNRYGVRS